MKRNFHPLHSNSLKVFFFRSQQLRWFDLSIIEANVIF